MIEQKNWVFYTKDRSIASQYRLIDNRPVFAKTEAYKKFLESQTRYIEFYYSYPDSQWNNIYVLPGIAATLPKLELKPHWMEGLYDYQEKAYQIAKEFTTKWLLIQSWTWSGKTFMMNAIYNWLDGKACFITFKTQVQQNINFEIQWAECYCLPTFKKMFKELNNWQALIIDECFIPWTLIDWNPIESIKIWDLVNSYNHLTNSIEQKEVLTLYKKYYWRDLYEINWNFVCTDSHPIYTIENWYCLAKDIKINNTMLSIDFTYNLYNERLFLWLLQRKDRLVSTIKKQIQSSQWCKCSVLFCKMLKETMKKKFTGLLLYYLQIKNKLGWTTITKISFSLSEISVLFKNMFSCSNGKTWSFKQECFDWTQQAICFWKNERKKSNAQSFNKTKGFNNIKEDETQTVYPMMKLKAFNYIWNCYVICSRLANKYYSKYLIFKRKIQRTKPLQNWFVKWIIKNSYRNRLKQSLLFKKKRTGSSQTIFTWRVRVESIKIHKYWSRERYKLMRWKNFVYNIEVKDNNNYFASNILVHNCHGLSDELRKLLCLWKWRVFWFTATPYRSDFEKEWFKIVFWTLFDTEAQALPVKVYQIKYDCVRTVEDALRCVIDLSVKSHHKWTDLLYKNAERTQFLVNLISNLLVKSKRVIVFTTRIFYRDFLYKILLEKHWPEKIFLLNKKMKKEELDRINSLDEYVLIANEQFAWEWVNIPSLNVWLLTFDTKNLRKIDQMVWRVRRKFWDKEYWKFVDVADIIRVGKSNPKYTWYNARKKIYSSLWYETN